MIARLFRWWTARSRAAQTRRAAKMWGPFDPQQPGSDRGEWLWINTEPAPAGWLRAQARWLWAEVRHVAMLAGYWIRPYDGSADARRWRWQPRYPCQFQDQAEVLRRWREEDGT